METNVEKIKTYFEMYGSKAMPGAMMHELAAKILHKAVVHVWQSKEVDARTVNVYSRNFLDNTCMGRFFHVPVHIYNPLNGWFDSWFVEIVEIEDPKEFGLAN